MKKCPKCKHPLRKSAIFCPICGVRIEKREKSRFLFILLITICIIVTGCCGGILIARYFGGRKNNVLTTLKEDHITEIKEDLKVFADGNISEITERVFGATSGKGSTSESNNGIIADLFTNAEVRIASTNDSNINYTILSPDISDFFIVCADQINAITTSEELGQAILEYAETAPIKEYTVSVPYSSSGESISVAYDNPDFINAMTGGLLDAYMVLYEQYLAEG